MKFSMKIIKALLILFFTVVVFGQIEIAQAADSSSIKIDGNFNDWSSVTKTKGGSNQFALLTDSNYVYIFIDSSFNSGSTYYNSVTLNYAGKTSYLTIKTSSNLTSSSKAVGVQGDLWNGSTGKDFTYSDGYITVDGGRTLFEGKVPLSELGEISDGEQVTMTDSNYQLSTPLTSASTSTTESSASSESTSSTSDSSSSVSTSSSSSSANNQTASSSNGEYTVGNYNIVIDGKFSDWDDISKTDIAESNDNYNIKQGAMVSDGKYLYIYIRMDYTASGAYNSLQTNGYDLTISGVKYYFTVVNPDGSSFNNTLKNVGDTEKIGIGLGKYSDTSFYSVPKNIEAIAAKLANTNGGSTDAMEIKIPLSDISSSDQQGQIITLKNSNLGDQTMTVSGGSTAPILLAGSGFAIAVFGVWKFLRAKKTTKGEVK